MNAHEVTGPGGTITVTPAALTQIVVRAAELADGARVRRPRRGLEIELENGHARVELELVVEFGLVLPDVAREVQERVSGALEAMCGLVVDAVDVSVEELEG
ncbi:MAG: Asp23/Gls24 family envelope stress response protein [Actinomycetota bacterium]